MAIATNLGFPRIGATRETKKAIEAYWKKQITQEELLNQTKAIRTGNWKTQKEASISHIPSNDFSLYDHMLDMSVLVGSVPSRYQWKSGLVDLDTFFAMARGLQGETASGEKIDVPAMEMTKWFDTNYHYIVPEFEQNQKFQIASEKPFKEFDEAMSLGIKTRPVLVGPMTFLLLGKSKDDSFNKLGLLDSLVNVYEEIVARLNKQGAEWIQLDDPTLALDRTVAELDLYKNVYDRIKKAAGSTKIIVTSYFEGLRNNLMTMVNLGVDAIHIDLVRAPEQLSEVLEKLPENMNLSLGVVNGRNIWKNNFEKSLTILKQASEKIGADRMFIAPSCSMLHSPIDLDQENLLDPDLKNWLAFAKQKLQEISILTKAITEGADSVKNELEENKKAHSLRSESPKIHNTEVKFRVKALTKKDNQRHNPFPVRRKKQQTALSLPAFPTTTIGSFPQTTEIRQARRNFKNGSMKESDYKKQMEDQIKMVVDKQEQIGLDVLVHGEPERNDMVEYFGEQLSGFAFTKFGWVQSYGSRCVKPPVIFGDVSRPEPMTISWSSFAQSLTKKHMKGMLTGPVTILQWSFVRDDQPRSETTKQIALSIRDEVVDLEKAGIKVIQIDEPAIREGLPLRRSDWKEYLNWSVESFRISASGVEDATQIHTHMCYSEFNDIIEAIGDMDADVITIEASRSDMELLKVFREYKYPNEIGPGVYDIHSPRIPSEEEMTEQLRKICKVLPADQIWVNPDCGLKTRGWKETIPSLENMVKAALNMRGKLAVTAK